MRARGGRGAAIVDFVLVLAVLVPLVRNTLIAAASEGARYAATLDRDESDGEARTRSQIDGALAAEYAEDVDAHAVMIDGAPGIEVTVHAVVPALGLGGPGISLTVTGHAIEEGP